MKTTLLMVNTLATLISRKYNKDMVFYNVHDDNWYSLRHCGEITTEQVCNWVLELYPPEV